MTMSRWTASGFVASALVVACLSAPARAQADAGSGASPPTKPPVPTKTLLHGNYCGPGNNAPLAPIDALDAACARHDACTPDEGLPARACNLRLQAEAEGVAQDSRQPAPLRALAGVVASGAAMMPFDPARPTLAPARVQPEGRAPLVREPYRLGDDDGEADEAAPE
ncbi:MULTISPECIES: hypothetical protein [unclassified Methylobacterium]|uniref:hypothetical protein n=1 Tax=unclassified Methylobacterium TaxID=2615210 RepID=UPI000A8640A7|nr:MULTISPECIES: hypothetical protein [unclassified Methylobacterium]